MALQSLPRTRVGLTEILRRAASTARNIKHKTDPMEIAQYAFEEASKLGAIDADFRHIALLEKISSLITTRPATRTRTDADDAQLTLLMYFDEDQEIVFNLKTEEGREQHSLMKFGIREIEIARKQKRNNIANAQAASQTFNQAADLISPVLQANPGWVWGDAVRHLRKIGGIPTE